LRWIVWTGIAGTIIAVTILAALNYYYLKIPPTFRAGDDKFGIRKFILQMMLAKNNYKN
jgi:hypothetical protein